MDSEQYKVVDFETGEVVDEKLTYNESMSYWYTEKLVVLEQDADINRAIQLISEIRLANEEKEIA